MLKLPTAGSISYTKYSPYCLLCTRRFNRCHLYCWVPLKCIPLLRCLLEPEVPTYFLLALSMYKDSGSTFNWLPNWRYMGYVVFQRTLYHTPRWKMNCLTYGKSATFDLTYYGDNHLGFSNHGVVVAESNIKATSWETSQKDRSILQGPFE